MSEPQKKPSLLRRVLHRLLYLVDDMLLVSGICFLANAGFILGEVYGWAVLGAGAIALAILVGRSIK